MDTVLQAYTLIESFEREVFGERYAVYLNVVYLRDGLGFLAFYLWDVHNDGQS